MIYPRRFLGLLLTQRFFTLGMRTVYLPKTVQQQQYVSFLEDRRIPIVVGIGPAGTGKTLFACLSAVESLQKGNIDKIVLTRPFVSVEEDMGFLPGTISKKMDPYTRPLFDVLGEFFSAREVEGLVTKGKLEVAPLGFMRGRTFKRTFIVADEMQNASPNQMLMLCTRLGEGTRMVITGDLNQSDRGGVNGLDELVRKIPEDDDLIKIVRFEDRDVQRSRVVRRILDIYREGGDGTQSYVSNDMLITKTKKTLFSGGSLYTGDVPSNFIPKLKSVEIRTEERL